MGSDLRTFLDEIDSEVLRIHKEVDPLTELGALCSQSGGPILFENLKGHPDWRVCDRLLGARKLQAAALRTTSDRLLQDAGTRIARGRGESRIVEDGPVKEVRIRGEDIDLQALPVGIHSQGDGGRYIGAGMCVTKDPSTGIQNQAFYRIQVTGRNRARFAVGRRTGWAHYTQYEKAGEPMPMAVVIGHHPAYEIASTFTAAHPGFEEFELASSLLEETVDFVRCETVDLRVPAGAEIVIEGIVPPKVRETEGPFGEYTGYMGPSGQSPVFEVKTITMRKDAIYRHLNASRFTDLQVLSTFLNEVRTYRNLQEVHGGTRILDVHIPDWAGLTAIVQMVPEFEGHSRAVLLAAMGLHRQIKVVMVVDDDVDIHDPKDVLWAMSFRVNPARDIITVEGTRGYKLDPSTPEAGREDRAGVTDAYSPGVMGIDATKPSLKRPADRALFERVRPVGEGEVFLENFV